MNLFGVDFTVAEVILLFSFLLVILLCINILHKLRIVKTKDIMQDSPAAEKVTAATHAAPTEGNELVAVLTAAVAMIMGKDAASVKIASVKRVANKTVRSGGGSAWARAGRIEQLTNVF